MSQKLLMSKGDVLATSPYIRLNTPTRKTLAHGTHVLAQEQTMPNESHTREKPRISRPDVWNAFCYLPYWELPNKSLLYSTLLYTHTHTHTHAHTHTHTLGTLFAIFHIGNFLIKSCSTLLYSTHTNTHTHTHTHTHIRTHTQVLE